MYLIFVTIFNKHCRQITVYFYCILRAWQIILTCTSPKLGIKNVTNPLMIHSVFIRKLTSPDIIWSHFSSPGHQAMGFVMAWIAVTYQSCIQIDVYFQGSWTSSLWGSALIRCPPSSWSYLPCWRRYDAVTMVTLHDAVTMVTVTRCCHHGNSYTMLLPW
jgi:hypothetical protein